MADRFRILGEEHIPWQVFRDAKRIVIKLGTKALITENGQFDDGLFEALARDIKTLRDQGKEILIVSSGAVNAGLNSLKKQKRPRDVIDQQVYAAIGNPLLIEKYRKALSFTAIAQILVTQEDLSNRKSFLNVRNTLERMVKKGYIPVINENDVVSINELYSDKETEYNFTDNDILAAIIAASMNAQLLIIFSDVDGLYTKHPNSEYKEFIPYVPVVNRTIREMGQTGTQYGRGGMTSKIHAAEIATQSGSNVFLCHAKKTSLLDIFSGQAKGTFFLQSTVQLTNKHRWLIYGGIVRGNLDIDKGAKRAITNGASLLFGGITGIEGDFQKNDIVTISYDDEVFAKGIVNYSTETLERFANMDKEEVLKYFKKHGIREIITHEKMGFGF